MRLDATDMAERLGARGSRLTPQRRAVVEALARTDAALSALQLFDAGRQECPDLGLTTVYRTLELLSEAGAIRRVHADGHCEAFVPAESDHGHSVVCVGCGKVGEFTDCDVSSLVRRAADETGFAIEEHFLQLSGVCAECQARGVRRTIEAAGSDPDDAGGGAGDDAGGADATRADAGAGHADEPLEAT
jgi:Fe2+ or Zn2+ uptake regulation protein